MIIMCNKIPLLLLAATTATAQLTTSLWMPSVKRVIGTDNLRWVASVIDASGDRLTLAYHLSNDPDYTALILNTNNTVTMTFAPTMVASSTSDLDLQITMSGDRGYSFQCERQAPEDDKATCTESLNSWMLNLAGCRPNTHPATVLSSEWTHSEGGTVGVETMLWTIGGQDGEVREWCTKEGAEPPSSEAIHTFTRDADYFATYEFIITAGEEKLRATTGAGPTGTDAKPTGTGASGTGPADATETGAAVPMKTMAPLVAGLGAAVAVFL